MNVDRCATCGPSIRSRTRTSAERPQSLQTVAHRRRSQGAAHDVRRRRIRAADRVRERRQSSARSRRRTRETEMAVRTALGAGRGRIIRQLITESVMLSRAGAMIGGALAGWAVDAIVAFGPKGLPRLDDIVVDARVLAFFGRVALSSPDWCSVSFRRFTRRGPSSDRCSRTECAARGRRATQRTRGALVVSELALAVVLLVGAGLLIRSFVKLMQRRSGLSDGAHRLVRRLAADEEISVRSRPPSLRRAAARRTVVAAGNAVGCRGVRAAARAAWACARSFDIEGRPPAPNDKRLVADVRPASSNFFSTMGIASRSRSRLYRRRGELRSAAGGRRHAGVRAKVFPE